MGIRFFPQDDDTDKSLFSQSDQPNGKHYRVAHRTNIGQSVTRSPRTIIPIPFSFEMRFYGENQGLVFAEIGYFKVCCHIELVFPIVAKAGGLQSRH